MRRSLLFGRRGGGEQTSLAIDRELATSEGPGLIGGQLQIPQLHGWQDRRKRTLPTAYDSLSGQQADRECEDHCRDHRQP